MELRLNEEERLLVDMVRDFAEKELRPTAAERDKTGTFPLEVFQQMAGLGLIGMTIPEEYGGSGIGAVPLALTMMEVARGDASVAVTLSVTNMVAECIYRFGSEEQRKRFLPKICKGPWPVGAFCLTESDAGSDAGHLNTRAVRKGSDYIINGSKIFISSGAWSSEYIVMARTSDTDSGPGGVSAFVVERGTEGMNVGKEEHKMGLRGSNTVELHFDNCRVPVENMLGREGDGFKVAMAALDGGRIGVASQAYGVGMAVLDAVREYAHQRIQFGKAIGEFQGIQFKIANMATELEAARLMILQAASMKDAGVNFTKQASMAKLFASEAANRAAKEGVQIYGGYGYSEEYVVARLFRDVKVTTIYEGTSEVQRIVIARETFKEG